MLTFPFLIRLRSHGRLLRSPWGRVVLALFVILLLPLVLWRVNNIEPDTMMLTYAGLANELEALLPAASQDALARNAR